MWGEGRRGCRPGPGESIRRPFLRLFVGEDLDAVLRQAMPDLN